ncbi:MAG: hypothetical protein ACXVEE_20465 [Polyangiales bacterium]
MIDPCSEIAEMIAVALAGPLPARLESHLDACPRCLALLEDTAVLGDAVQHVFSREGDDYQHASDFEARVLAAIDPDPEGVEPTRPMRRLRLQM